MPESWLRSFWLLLKVVRMVAKPKLTDRTLFIGQTGSGKTYASLRWLGWWYPHRQIIVLDTKADDAFDRLDAEMVDRASALVKEANRGLKRRPILVYRPRAEELADQELLDRVADWIYRRGHTALYVDEVSQVTDGARASAGWLNVITRGRKRGVAVIGGTQRPVWIPRIWLTEAQHVLKFWLADERDRQRVAEATHPDMAAQVEDPHGFHYYRQGSRNVEYYPSIEKALGLR